MPRTASGQQGVHTELNGETGRAIVETLKNTFTVVDPGVQDEYQASIKICMRKLDPEEAKPGDTLMMIYTDKTKYLQLWAPKRFMAGLRKDFKKITIYYHEVNRAGAYNFNQAHVGITAVPVPTLDNPQLQGFLATLPIPAESSWWNTVRAEIMGPAGEWQTTTTPPGARPQPKAKAAVKKEEKPIVPKDENHAAIMSEFAEQIPLSLELWPDARESLIQTLVKHGAQVKKEKDDMSGKEDWIKKEPTEWIYIGDEGDTEPGTASGA